MKAMPGELAPGGQQTTGHHGQHSVVQNCKDRRSEFHRPSDLVIAKSMSRHVLGVVLADDRPADCSKQAPGECLPLGVILLDNLDIQVDELQRTMKAQLPSLPGSFNIITKEGFPVHKHQENKVHVSYIIRDDSSIMIRTHFERPRAGIITTCGDSKGFIFIDYQWSILQIREAIAEQLTTLTKRQEYRFVDRNGWPVDSRQEAILTALDIIRKGYNIYIQYGDKSCPPQPLELPLAATPRPILPPRTRSKPTFNARIKLPSLKKRKGDLVAKPILISYVRQEAVQHAKDLKEGLLKLGFSVYLDVHEIRIGSDWQDALNYAVSNCKFFVPLITPMYGKTQWTNREVKLADVLGKNIIPISFIEQWPPECLAIQFASTQYIPWKLPESDHARGEADFKSVDPRVWEDIHIKRVCKELGERCRTTAKKTNENEKLNGTLQSPNSCFSPNVISKNKEKFVVISAHPKQKVLIHQLRVTLEREGYDVWCSSDLQESQDIISDDFSPSSGNTPRELNSIPEGSIFGQTYNEIANAIADSKRGATLRSETDGCPERKQLTRMISQVSDISQVSSLTPDKMERLRSFQQKVDLAGVVIIIVSEDYTKSKTSQQQVFYCEHRKRVVLVKFDKSQLPSWFTMLMGNDMISNIQSAQFIAALKAQVKRCLNPSSSETPKDATFEAKIQCLVNFMKKNISQPQTCVYIAGSSKLTTSRSNEIAKAIGKELAKVKNITLCTGGFYGTPEIVAKAFFAAFENNREALDEIREPVVHLLPFKDSMDFTQKAHQNPDGSFEAVSYGKTHFVGDSVKERETAVARLFDTCIVIEGGPGAAHEVEEFIWNDHFVVPIISTGGAAGGQYGVPVKIFEAPPCVSKSDWCVLSEKEAEPETVAKAVVNIVADLKQSILNHSISQELQVEPTKTRNKSRINRSRKSKMSKNSDQSKPRQLSQKDELTQTREELYASDISGHRLLERQMASYDVRTPYKHATKWQRFLNIFSTTKLR